MKTKSKNDTAFNYSIGFSIVVYFILLLYIGLFAAHINEVILVLIPILIIEFSKAIFEALADKNEVYIYERNRETLGILAPHDCLNRYTDFYNDVHNQNGKFF